MPISTELDKEKPNYGMTSSIELVDILINVSSELKRRHERLRMTPPPTFHQLVERYGEDGSKKCPREVGYLDVIPTTHCEYLSEAVADECPYDTALWTETQIEKHPEAFKLLSTTTADTDVGDKVFGGNDA